MTGKARVQATQGGRYADLFAAPAPVAPQAEPARKVGALVLSPEAFTAILETGYTADTEGARMPGATSHTWTAPVKVPAELQGDLGAAGWYVMLMCVSDLPGQETPKSQHALNTHGSRLVLHDAKGREVRVQVLGSRRK